MTTLTWLGEDDEKIGYAGPSHMVWGGLKFPKDKPVEVSDKDMIRRARGNRFFEVQESAGAEESASVPPNSPQKRGPGRPPKVREPIAGED